MEPNPFRSRHYLFLSILTVGNQYSISYLMLSFECCTTNRAIKWLFPLMNTRNMGVQLVLLSKTLVALRTFMRLFPFMD